MRVAFIVNKFPTLSETFILNQITGLIDRGHTVDIFADSPRNDPKTHPDVERYRLLEHTRYYNPYRNTPANKPRRLLKALRLVARNAGRHSTALLHALNVFEHGKEAASLRKLYTVKPFLRRAPYDVIHCHFGVNGIFGAQLRRIGALQGKLVTTVYGYDITSYVQQHGPQVYHELFADGDLFLHISQYQQAKLLAFGCDARKTRLHRIGVDIDRFDFAPRALREDEPVRILTVARLVEKKGLEYSIRAAAQAARVYPQLKYRIAGDGDLRPQLQRLIDDLGANEHVELLGWKNQDEVRALFADSHLFVLSSVTAASGDEEGQGLVLQEAQAMGLPVVCTRHNGFPEGVVEGESAYLVPERDPEALAAALVRLIREPQRWPAMGWAGRQHVEAHFDNNKLNDQLVDIYEQVLDRPHAIQASVGVVSSQ